MVDCDPRNYGRLSELPMQAFQIWQRRWVLTGFLLVLALIGAGAAASKEPRTYQAGSTIVLLASHNSAKATAGGNPYLSFSDSLSTTASVISTEIMSPPSVAMLKTLGFTESYQVVSQSTLSNSSLLPAPFLLVTVTGSNGALVEHTLHGVTSDINMLLNKLQTGISHNNKIVSVTASLDPKATLSVISTARPLIGILGLLIVLALGIPLLIDARSARRRIRAGFGAATPPVAAGREGRVSSGQDFTRSTPQQRKPGHLEVGARGHHGGPQSG